MPIQIGQTAPHFQALDVWGKSTALSDYAGKLLLLSFFRNGACALCNLRVHHLIQRYPAYKAAGLEVLAVFESPQSSLQQYVGKQDVPFALVSDPQAELYELYGVETSEEKVKQTMQMPHSQEVIAEAATQGFALTPEAGSNFNRIPADFLIAADGTVLLAHHAAHLTDHLSFELLEQQLKGLETRMV